MKYCLCMYDLDGNEMSASCFSCMGCAWRHAPKHAPCCLRKGSKTGPIVKTNEYFKRANLGRKVK